MNVCVKAMLDLAVPETDPSSRVFFRPIGDPDIGYVHTVIRCVKSKPEEPQPEGGTETAQSNVAKCVDFCLRVGQVGILFSCISRFYNALYATVE
jgi:hypothetical protein